MNDFNLHVKGYSIGNVGKIAFISSLTFIEARYTWHSQLVEVSVSCIVEGRDLTKVTNPERWVASLGLPLV